MTVHTGLVTYKHETEIHENLSIYTAIPSDVHCNSIPIHPLMNYKQLHKQLTTQLQYSKDLYDFERERIKQRIHYIETEYDYRPRYKHSDLRPRCKGSRRKG